MQNAITIPVQISNWHVKQPTVVRYIESQYVDDFFNSGELMLSSVKKFYKHKDEQRGDMDEGKAHLNLNIGGMPLQGLVAMGSDAFILSTSCIEDGALMEQLGYTGAIRINDTIAFAHAIARSISGFHGGTQGFCIYRDSKLVVQNKIDMDFPQMPPSGDEAIKMFHKLNSAVWEASALEPLFRKPIKYASQNEYRFVWFSSEAHENDSIVIKAPEAIQFCEKITKIESGLDMEVNIGTAKISMHSTLADAKENKS